MDSAKYFILVGTLLFIMAIGPGLLKKLPFTSSVIYLLFGILLGSHGLNIIHLNSAEHSKIIEHLSELTVIISLFTVGLKLQLKISDSRWLLPISLASLSMVFTVGLISFLGIYFLELSLGQAVLLGAVLAPTDPVLASEVQLKDPNDRNLKKFILTSEGGMNDGTAFPFVMLGLGLLMINNHGWSFGKWFMLDLVWAISGGLMIGVLTGFLTSKIARYVRVVHDSFYLEDFLTISAIALSYGVALQCHSYGFLSVFACALTIRQLEMRLPYKEHKSSKDKLPDAVLSFNEQLERIFEVIAVGIVGLLIDFRSLSWNYFFVALAVIIFIRPISVFAGTAMSGLKRSDKVFLSWFGVRGIGSIYYLYYAINHVDPPFNSTSLQQYTLWTIFFSIFIHGFSAKIIEKRYEERKAFDAAPMP